MKFFNARFNPTSVDYLSNNNQFTLTGNVIDNTGTYFATDAKVGDIIYLNGSSAGDLILRYKILEINSASGLKLIAKVEWDMEGDIIAPQAAVEGIIGARINNSELSMITNIFTNNSDELLVSAARSYEQSLLVKENSENIASVESKIKIPTLGYSLVEN